MDSSHLQHALFSHCPLCLSVAVTPGYFCCRGIPSPLSPVPIFVRTHLLSTSSFLTRAHVYLYFFYVFQALLFRRLCPCCLSLLHLFAFLTHFNRNWPSPCLKIFAFEVGYRLNAFTFTLLQGEQAFALSTALLYEFLNTDLSPFISTVKLFFG